MSGERARQALSDRRQLGRRPGAVPEERADPCPSAVMGRTDLALGAAAPGIGGGAVRGGFPTRAAHHRLPLGYLLSPPHAAAPGIGGGAVRGGFPTRAAHHRLACGYRLLPPAGATAREAGAGEGETGD